MSALSVIVFSEAVTLRDLAAAEQVRPPTMTRLVDALEDAGLVTRKSDPTDGRRVWITATRRGKAIMARGRTQRVNALTRQVRLLPAKDRAVLGEAAKILDRIIEEL
jgi:DNA-binding MarR family transcriptional regulator